MENTLEQKNYLINAYLEDEIDSDEWFNPYIDPRNSYIPICSQCNIDFENFIRNGFIRCKVKNGIQRRYFFVKDEFGNDYYVNKDVIKYNSDALNQELFPNQFVFIKTEDTRAVECVFV